jgi:hypothetical protein
LVCDEDKDTVEDHVRAHREVVLEGIRPVAVIQQSHIRPRNIATRQNETRNYEQCRQLPESKEKKKRKMAAQIATEVMSAEHHLTPSKLYKRKRVIKKIITWYRNYTTPTVRCEWRLRSRGKNSLISAESSYQ